MSEYKVLLSQAALSDLDEIASYIVLALNAPKAASDTLNAIGKTINSLEALPFRYPVSSAEPFVSLQVRFVPVKNFIVYYTSENKTHTVNVVRIVYAKRDMTALEI